MVFIVNNGIGLDPAEKILMDRATPTPVGQRGMKSPTTMRFRFTQAYRPPKIPSSPGSVHSQLTPSPNITTRLSDCVKKDRLESIVSVSKIFPGIVVACCYAPTGYQQNKLVCFDFPLNCKKKNQLPNGRRGNVDFFFAVVGEIET